MNSYQKRAASEPHFWNYAIEQATGRAFNWKCPFCSLDILEHGYIRAHISPVGTGVGMVPGNIVLSCNSCNLSMGDNHAFTWCQWQGIDFGHIAIVLDTLRKVLLDVECLPETARLKILRPTKANIAVGVKQRSIPNIKTSAVIYWLENNPDKRDWSVRKIANEIGVSKSWVAIAINKLNAG